MKIERSRVHARLRWASHNRFVWRVVLLLLLPLFFVGPVVKFLEEFHDSMRDFIDSWNAEFYDREVVE